MLNDFGEDSGKSVGLCSGFDPVRKQGDSAVSRGRWGGNIIFRRQEECHEARGIIGKEEVGITHFNQDIGCGIVLLFE